MVRVPFADQLDHVTCHVINNMAVSHAAQSVDPQINTEHAWHPGGNGVFTELHVLHKGQ